MTDKLRSVDSDRADLAESRVAIIATQWNPRIVGALREAARERLEARGVQAPHIREYMVPGAFEIPLLADRLAAGAHCDGIVALGAVIKGETAHFDYVAGECARGIAEVSRQYGLPIGFGVLATYDLEQALARSGDDEHNKGIEAADAVVDMLVVLRQLEP